MKTIQRMMILSYFQWIQIMRTYQFLILLGLVMALGYFLVPPADAGYQTMYVGEVRSTYNSAWLGAVAALSSSLFLWPFGFYLLRSKITEDKQQGVGSFLVSSPIRNFQYVFSKWMSHFLTFAVMGGVLELAFIAMQYIRQEDTQFVLSDYLFPYLWMVLPSLLVLAGLTILFDILPFLRGVIGNTIFFSIWTAVSALSFSGVGDVDIFGTQVIFTEILHGIHLAFPEVNETSVNFGYQIATSLSLFDWTGIRWSTNIFAERLFWLLVAEGLFLIGVGCFRRKSLLPLETNPPRREKTDPFIDDSNPHSADLETISLSPVGEERKHSFPQLFRLELKLLFRAVPVWWQGVGIVLFLLTLCLPVSTSKIGLFLVWLWLIPLLSSMGAREKMFQTEALLFTNCPPHLHLWAVWLAGVVGSFLMTLGGTIQILLSGDWSGFSAWITAVLFAPTFALAAGIWSGTRKFYETIFVLWWMMGPVQNAPYLDFIGIQDPTLTPIYLLLTVAFAIAAVVGRKKGVRGN